MYISHVAIVTGESDSYGGKMSIVESTNITPRNHTLSDNSTVNCGVRTRSIVNAKPEEIVLVARIQV